MPKTSTIQIKIPTKAVQHRWQCPRCDNLAEVTGSDYQTVGTPVCADCNQGMDYSDTYINCSTKLFDQLVDKFTKLLKKKETASAHARKTSIR